MDCEPADPLHFLVEDDPATHLAHDLGLLAGPDLDADPAPDDTWRPWLWAGVADVAELMGADDWAADWAAMYDAPQCVDDPFLSVDAGPIHFDLGTEDIAGVIDTLFAQDTIKQKDGITYEWIMGELGKYTEGNPKTGPVQLTQAFKNNDPSVPEHVKFGPAATMTQIVRRDEGVAHARQAFLSGQGNLTSYRFRVDDFLRETGQLEAPVVDGKLQLNESELTEHMLGSYGVRVAETPDGQLLFMVFNETGLESGSRIPCTDISLFDNIDRSQGKGFGTIYQAYYWTEPKPAQP